MRIGTDSTRGGRTVVAFAVLALFIVTSPSQAEQSPEWEVALNEEGIKVSTREVPGSSYEEYKGVTTVPASAASVMAIFTDPGANQEWLHGCSKLETIENSGFHSQTLYQVFDFPWPATDRDFVIDFDIRQTGENEFFMAMHDRSDKVSKKIDRVRAKMASGYYEIRQVSTDKTEVVMAQHVEPNGDLPAWMVNSLITDTPFHSLKNLRDMVTRETYSNAAFVRDEEGRVSGVTH